jgi:hypothetical protein
MTSILLTLCSRLHRLLAFVRAVEASAYEETELALARQSLAEHVTYGDESRRLAVLHLEWDHLRAVDLYVLFHSFVPPSGGAVRSVAVYASDFGVQRMAEVPRALANDRFLFLEYMLMDFV